MTRGGTDRRNTCSRAARACRRSQLGLRAARGRSQLYGDSPASQSSVPITSALFESCSRNPTLAARNGLHHQYAAQQWGSPSGRPWSPGYPGQARARDLAPALCRALMVQAVTIYKSSRAQRSNPAASVGIPRAALATAASVGIAEQLEAQVRASVLHERL
jgi:hypothetical protein